MPAFRFSSRAGPFSLTQLNELAGRLFKAHSSPTLAGGPSASLGISAAGFDARYAPQLEAAKKFVLTVEDKEQQRRSFAYGNTVIERRLCGTAKAVPSRRVHSSTSHFACEKMLRSQ